MVQTPIQDLQYLPAKVCRRRFPHTRGDRRRSGRRAFPKERRRTFSTLHSCAGQWRLPHIPIRRRPRPMSGWQTWHPETPNRLRHGYRNRLRYRVSYASSTLRRSFLPLEKRAEMIDMVVFVFVNLLRESEAEFFKSVPPCLVP